MTEIGTTSAVQGLDGSFTAINQAACGCTTAQVHESSPLGEIYLVGSAVELVALFQP
jgi:hypothetical protein